MPPPTLSLSVGTSLARPAAAACWLPATQQEASGRRRHSEPSPETSRASPEKQTPFASSLSSIGLLERKKIKTEELAPCLALHFFTLSLPVSLSPSLSFFPPDAPTTGARPLPRPGEGRPRPRRRGRRRAGHRGARRARLRRAARHAVGERGEGRRRRNDGKTIVVCSAPAAPRPSLLPNKTPPKNNKHLLFSFSQLASSADLAPYHALLSIFAFGTWADYRRESTTLPRLSAAAAAKLKALTLAALAGSGRGGDASSQLSPPAPSAPSPAASSRRMVPYSALAAAIDASSTPELEDLLIRGVLYAGLVDGKLDQRGGGCLRVRSVPASLAGGGSCSSCSSPAAAHGAAAAAAAAASVVGGKCRDVPPDQLKQLAEDLSAWRDAVSVRGERTVFLFFSCLFIRFSRFFSFSSREKRKKKS